MTHQDWENEFKRIYNDVRLNGLRRSTNVFEVFEELFGQYGDYVEDQGDDPHLLAGLRHLLHTKSFPYSDHRDFWWCTRREHNESSNYFDHHELFGVEGFHRSLSLREVIQLLGQEVTKRRSNSEALEQQSELFY